MVNSLKQFETIGVLNTMARRFVKAPSSDWMSSKLTTEAHSKHWRKKFRNVQHKLEEL